MNVWLRTPGIGGQAISVDTDEIISETLSGSVRFLRVGGEVDRHIAFKPADGGERRIGFEAGRVVEVAGPADWPGLAQAVRVLRSGEAVDDWRAALFGQCGELFVETARVEETADEVVCACRGSRRGEIRALAAEGLDRAGIGRACGAGTVCGSCAPLIDDIAGRASLLACELVAVERIDRDVARFRFRSLGGVASAGAAGSHVLLQALVDGRWLSRPYTVASRRGADLDVIVQREPGGLFSRWLHDHAGPDSLFRLSAPQGGSRAGASGRTLFIAGGIGITPALLRAEAAFPGALRVHWSARASRMRGLIARVCGEVRALGHEVVLRDTEAEGRIRDWGALYPADGETAVVVCGGPAFQASAVADLVAAGWHYDQITVESFGAREPAPAQNRHVDSFDYLQEPVVADSFHLRPARSVADEARAFLRQFYFEHGAPAAFEARWAAVSAAIAATGTYRHTYEELAFGARIAWRNAARCIGRFFWKTLEVRDCRHLRTEEEMFAAIVDHLVAATRGGDIKPVITVFPADGARFRILNPQLVLYAGHERADGSVVGDPKNVDLTRLAARLGWTGTGGRFDVLPVIIQREGGTPRMFELPREAVLEVELTHPRCPAFAALGLRWFAVPAVSGMALDVGGVQFTAAPSNGFYMGTEIGSMNLGDPSRYDELGRVAAAMGYGAAADDPLWRDRAMLDLNVAVLHSFAKAGVRILDHHTLSDLFAKFRAAEAAARRPSYGHWAWVMPPMGGNLSAVWRDNTLQKKILKPNYFYQASEASGAAASCPALRGAARPPAAAAPDR